MSANPSTRMDEGRGIHRHHVPAKAGVAWT